jgi:phage minor structural protein
VYKATIINNGTETVIHFPDGNNNTPKCGELKLNLKRSQTPQLTFSFYPNNPAYNLLTRLVTLVKIYDTRDNTVKFDGRVFQITEQMDNTGLFYKEVICYGVMDYLNDSLTEEYSYEGVTPLAVITDLLQKHNARIDSWKQIQPGNITVSDNLWFDTEYETTLEAIQKYVLDTSKGNISIRNVNGVNYLDYTVTIGDTVNITLGQNMAEMVAQDDPNGIATRIIPIGQDYLTIASANGGINYLENTPMKNKYGIIYKKVEYKDIDIDTDLLDAATADLAKYTTPQQILTSTASDLSVLANTSENTFDITTTVNINNPVMGINNVNYQVVEVDVDLTQPWNPTLQISNQPVRVTDSEIEYQGTSKVVNKITTSNDNVNTKWLEGIINTLQNGLKASGSYQHATPIEDKGFLLENIDANSSDYGALYLGPGFMAIANTKNSDGSWNWRSFGTGAGFTADEIKGGTIQGALLKTANATNYMFLHDQWIDFYNNNQIVMQCGFLNFNGSKCPLVTWGDINQTGTHGIAYINNETIVLGDLDTFGGEVSSNGLLVATQNWVENQGYMTAAGVDSRFDFLLSMGASGTFTSQDGKTITVSKGLITNIQ